MSVAQGIATGTAIGLAIGLASGTTPVANTAGQPYGLLLVLTKPS